MAAQDFLQEYADEVREHLQELESSLLILEREGTNKEEINQIFRAAHSIKGASAYMGFERLAGLTHELESLMSEIQAQSRPVPPEGSACSYTASITFPMLSSDFWKMGKSRLFQKHS